MPVIKSDIQKQIKNLSWITLDDVENTQIDTGRLLVSDFDNAERYLCIYLVQQYYNQILTDNNGVLNRAGKIKALAFAKFTATRRLASETDGLIGLVERAKLYLLNDAQETGWHHALEYDDVAELLSAIVEGKEGMTEAYDWKFIVEQLIPAAEKAGIPSGVLAAASENVKKMRGIVPAARELLRRTESKEIPLQEAGEQLGDWLNKVVNPNVTYAGLREDLDKWRGLSTNRDEPFKGYKIMMPNGHFLIAIETSNDKEVAIIEQALKNRVDIIMTGFDWLLKKVYGQSKKARLDESS